jgi:predicted TIM-barrel fold metal-dependent hydrolase
MLMVDSHAHIWLKNLPKINSPRHALEYDFSIETYLKILSDHHIDYAVIAAASPFGDYNDYTIQSISNNPKLRGTVILEPTVDQYSLKQMSKDGIVGVRLPYISMEKLPDLSSFEYRKLFKRFADLNWHVHLHIDGPRIPLVLPFLEKSGVKIVLDHFGRPDELKGIHCEGFQMMMRSMEKGNTWVKVSAAYRLGKKNTMEYGAELLRNFGADRLLWASDCPYAGFEDQVTYQETIDDIKSWVSNPSDLSKIYGENALKLYYF